MTNAKKRWSGDAGSVDFVQLVVGLMIVGIASIGTFKALQFGNDQMNEQMRYRKAMSIARSAVEYWQGRIHTDSPDSREFAGNLNSPESANNQVMIDEQDPEDPSDDIIGHVRYGQIVAKRNIDLGNDDAGQPLISHYIIRTRVTWREPGSDRLHEVKFQGTMVPAAL